MSRYSRVSGLSLIEMMVAMLIGTILVLGLVQVFSASRSAYQLSEGLSRVQENGRFAMDYLQRDIRMAGHFGCVNDQAYAMQGGGGLSTTFAAGQVPLQFNVSIQGYEASGTSPGATGVSLAETPATGGTFSPSLPAPIAADTAGRIANSDILVLRYLAAEGVPVTAVANTATATTFQFDASRWDALRGGQDNPGLFAVADCTSATVFEASTGSNGAGGVIVVNKSGLNDTTITQLYEAGQAVLYRAEVVVYYVARRNGATRPSLWRLRYTAAPGGVATVPVQEELVEGIENLQFLYGQDRELRNAFPPTGYIDKLGTATNVTAWMRVGTVQVGVVASSPDRAGAPQKTLADALNASGTRFAPADDGRYRAVYQSTVALRNRLYGQ